MNNSIGNRMRLQILISFLLVLLVYVGIVAIANQPTDNSTPLNSQSSNPTASQNVTAVSLTEEIKSSLPIELSTLVKEATLVEPGRVQIKTSIIDPRGEQGSPQAQQALAICNLAVSKGYSYVSLIENDGTSYALFGHPAYPGDACSEV